MTRCGRVGRAAEDEHRFAHAAQGVTRDGLALQAGGAETDAGGLAAAGRPLERHRIGAAGAAGDHGPVFGQARRAADRVPVRFCRQVADQAAHDQPPVAAVLVPPPQQPQLGLRSPGPRTHHVGVLDHFQSLLHGGSPRCRRRRAAGPLVRGRRLCGSQCSGTPGRCLSPPQPWHAPAHRNL